MAEVSVLFIGLGGAGQRHLRIARELFPHMRAFIYRPLKISPTLNADFTVDQDSSIEEKYSATAIDQLDRLPVEITHAVISTPPATHVEYAKLCLDKGLHVLCEKPAITRKDDFEVLQNAIQVTKGSMTVGFQRMFNPISGELVKEIRKSRGEIERIDIRVSSWCPGWHPYQDYKELYATNLDMGGGPLLTECHEIFMIMQVLGRIDKCSRIKSSQGEHQISSHEREVIEAVSEGITIHADLSIFRRPMERIVEVCYKDGRKMLYDYLLNYEGESRDYIGYSLADLDKYCFRKQMELFITKPEMSSNCELLRGMASVLG